MRKIFLASAAMMLVNLLQAQQKEGKVIYERTIQMQIRLADNEEAERMLPKTRTDKFELSFGNNQSLWKHMDEDDNNDQFGENGMQIRMVGPGQDDIVFNDFTRAQIVEQRGMFDKKFIVEDSIHKLNWKLSEETQTILGHVCRKATAQRMGKSYRMTMDNGKMERKEFDDTTNIVAWFTTDIPVSAGPEVQGQLPGLILALDMNNGRMVYKAIELSPKVEIASIKAPTKGKKLTPQEFIKERDKIIEEMQKNNQGSGNRVIIRN